MAVPTYDQFIEPILRFLSTQSAPVAAKDAYEAAANALGLTPEQRQETVPSGQLVYKNRCGWAHDRLKRSGYSTSPKHGYWRLTPAGVDYAKKAPSPLPPTEVERIASESIDVRLNRPWMATRRSLQHPRFLLPPKAPTTASMPPRLRFAHQWPATYWSFCVQ